jgi:hypothetical protein
MKLCPLVPEICRGQVHGAWKERQISGTTGQNFMKLGGVIDICF